MEVCKIFLAWSLRKSQCYIATACQTHTHHHIDSHDVSRVGKDVLQNNITYMHQINMQSSTGYIHVFTKRLT